MKTIDLHGTKHEEAEDRLNEFVVFNEPPFRIITGHSLKMRAIAEKIVDRHEYICYYESVHNQGSLVVTEKEWRQ